MLSIFILQRQIEMMSFYLLDLSIVDASFSVIRPSVKCAAAVCLSCHLVGTMPISESLVFGHRIVDTSADRSPVAAQLTLCIRRMARALLHATVSRDPQVRRWKRSGDNSEQYSLASGWILSAWGLVWNHKMAVRDAIFMIRSLSRMTVYRWNALQSITCMHCLSNAWKVPQIYIAQPIRMLSVGRRTIPWRKNASLVSSAWKIYTLWSMQRTVTNDVHI